MIEINNTTAIYIDKKLFARIAQKVLKLEKKKSDLSIVFVGSARIKELNKKYRKKDKATDVLSFGQFSSDLAEIVICPETVRKNAKKFKISYNRELARVLIHGVLHILGYNHERSKKEAEIMRKKEEYYLSKITS